MPRKPQSHISWGTSFILFSSKHVRASQLKHLVTSTHLSGTTDIGTSYIPYIWGTWQSYILNVKVVLMLDLRFS